MFDFILPTWARTNKPTAPDALVAHAQANDTEHPLAGVLTVAGGFLMLLALL